MAQNEHKKVIRQLTKAYQNVYKEERSVRYGEEDPREGRVYLSGKIEGVQKTIDVPAGASNMIDHWIKKGLQVVDKPSEEAEDVDHLAAEVKKRTRGWMAKEGEVGQRMTAEQAFKAAIEMIQWDLGNYTIDNIEL